MFVPIPQRYKIPLLISLAIALVFVALTAESNWLRALFAFVGSVFGILLLDLEYIIHVYVVDPGHEKAAQIKEFVKNKRFFSLVRFINETEYTFGEMSIRSVLFQALLTVFGLYVVTTSINPLVVCMTLSMLANLLYAQIIEYDRTSTLQRWFWVYNGELTRNVYIGYMITMGLAILLELYFLV